MSRRSRIYIAGPLQGSGNPYENVHRALDAATVLLDRGYAPYVPHLNVLWEIALPRRTEDWIALDLEYVSVCDALLRLPGGSPGADREVDAALKIGIPVFLNLDTLLAQIPPSILVEPATTTANRVGMWDQATYMLMKRQTETR